MSENYDDRALQVPAENPVGSSDKPADLSVETVSQSNADTPGTAIVEAQGSAAGQFPITDKAEKVNPPLTLEEKRKVWIRRLIGAIVFFAVLGSLALLAAAQAVTFLFKQILPP